MLSARKQEENLNPETRGTECELTLSKDPQDLKIALALIRTIEAEKRTHLAELRTGIGILTIPMSLLTILIATSNYYSIDTAFSFIIGLVIGIIALSLIGGYLVIRSLQKLRATEELRHSCKDVACLLEDYQHSE